STQRKADAIILTSPFTSLLNMARQKNAFIRHMPNLALPRQHLDNVAVLRKSHPPLLILHGTEDTLIPISESEKLFESAAEPKQFVRLPKVGHNDIF
ncbi:alpha/beta hydrolase, partial [Acinetobacter baumannii]